MKSLLILLTENEEMVRSSPAKALGEIGDERAVMPLIAVLKIDKVEFRYAHWIASVVDTLRTNLPN